jgi:hypothetical protein
MGESELDPVATDDEGGESEALDEFLSKAWDEFHRLATSPDDQADLLAVLEMRLRPEVNSGSFNALREALAPLMGYPALSFLVQLARRTPSGKREEFKKATGTPEATRFVRRLVALYGPELARAWALWPQTALRHDWHAFNSNLYYDPKADQWMVHVAIRKRNGELAKIEGPLDSITRLTQRMVGVIGSVPDIEGFNERDVAELFETVDTFRSWYDEERASKDDSAESS